MPSKSCEAYNATTVVAGGKNMTTQVPSGFRTEPDMTVSTVTRVPTGNEFIPLDKQAGMMTVNKWLLKPIRTLMPTIADRLLGKPDMSGLWTTEIADVGNGILVVRPQAQTARGAVLLIHGGGYVMGRKEDVLAKAAAFARDIGVAVFCPGYRVAPENAYPAGLDDCHAAWCWLRDNAEDYGVDPARIVIGGYSAGGGMAASLAQRISDDGGTQPSGQLLVYPMADDQTAAKRELDKPRHRVWSNANNLFGWTSYLGGPPGTDVGPYAVPARRQDLSGLPTAWVGVGTSDLFLDESREYARRLREARVEVSYVEIEGGIHGFDNAEGSPLADAFNASATEFVRTHAV